MPAKVIDGTAIARQIRAELADAVATLVAGGTQPGLTVVLVGDDPASAVYVRAKGKACEELGMRGETVRLPASTSQAELLALLERLNADDEVHGILVQMPLPKHMDPDAVIQRIAPGKDVDGFHPVSVGNLLIGGRRGFAPCTPAGVQELLVRSGVETRGAECVIVGRSNIVGKPMAALMIQAGAGADSTVTVCHSRTRDLPGHVRRADIVIAAVGRPEMITGEMLKPGAVVVDVGINRVDDASVPRGYRLVGDVHFASAVEVVSQITPVPGGVGPMTIAMLMRNTVAAAERAHARRSPVA